MNPYEEGSSRWYVRHVHDREMYVIFSCACGEHEGGGTRHINLPFHSKLHISHHSNTDISPHHQKLFNVAVTFCVLWKSGKYDLWNIHSVSQRSKLPGFTGAHRTNALSPTRTHTHRHTHTQTHTHTYVEITGNLSDHVIFILSHKLQYLDPS